MTLRPGAEPSGRPSSPNRRRLVEVAVAYLEGRPPAAGAGTALHGRLDEASHLTPESLGIRKLAELLSAADGEKRSTSVPLFEFPERASLIAAVAAEGFRRLVASLQTELATDYGDGAGRLEALTLGYVRWAMRHPVLFRAMYDPSLAPGVEIMLLAIDDRERRAHLAARYRAHRDAEVDDDAPAPDAAEKRRRIVRNRQDRKRLASFAELFEGKVAAFALFERTAVQGIRDGSLRTTDPRLAAHAMTALADGLAWQFVTEPQLTADHLESHARRVLDLFMPGLRAEPSTAPGGWSSGVHGRASWPVRVLHVAESTRDDLRGETTPAARLAMVHELTERAWTLGGLPRPDYPRSAMPVRIERW